MDIKQEEWEIVTLTKSQIITRVFEKLNEMYKMHNLMKSFFCFKFRGTKYSLELRKL